jgi:multidrug efflux pump subunit AcrA (membrane-fusion protein)
MIGIAIILYVTWQIPILGVLMAAAGVVTWVVAPLFKLFKYLTLEPELHRKRGRAWAFCFAVAGAIFIVVGLIQFPMSVNGEGLLEPKQKEFVRAETPGFVREVRVKDDQLVKKGEVLVVLGEDRIDANIAQLNAELARLQAEYGLAAVKDESQRNIVANRIAQVRQQLADVQRQKDEMTIRAPIDGRVVSPHIHQLQGRYLRKGDEVAVVAQLDRLYVYATFEQTEGELLFGKRNATEVRLIGMPDTTLHAEHPEVVPAAVAEMRHPLVTQVGGGTIPVDPRDPSKPLVRPFELRAELANPEHKYVPGQRAYVRVLLDRKPLAWQWSRRFLQLIQSRSAGSKWL